MAWGLSVDYFKTYNNNRALAILKRNSSLGEKYKIITELGNESISSS